MNNHKIKYIVGWILLALAFLIFMPTSSFAITKVGNSDDGSDLEGASPLEFGSIVKARKKAVARLQKMNVPAIAGLGTLLPEVEKTSLFMATADITTSLTSDQGHTSLSGNVYARTLAQPHAATRFFPVAASLEEAQLVALHIHEGLHRALDPSVREDESLVAKLTLTITAPEATFDSIQRTAEDLLPKQKTEEPKEVTYFTGSSVGYSYRRFFNPDKPTSYPVTSMHLLHSHLYPLGGKKTRFGLGIEFSLIQGPHGSNMGPLGLSAHFRLFQVQGFEMALWGIAHLNTLSADELKQSPYGRDVGTLGFSIRKNGKSFYIENYTSVAFGGSSNQKVGLVEYKYSYGSVFDVKIRAGVRTWKIDAGGYAELHLADYFKVNGGAFSLDTGRYRIFSVGPEANLQMDDFVFSLLARFLVNSTKNASYDFLGNLMGPGVSQGSVGASVKMIF